MKKAAFVWPVRVYYEDTDAGGVVYYANYLKFMERARSEMLRSLGVEQDVLRRQQGILFAVHSLCVDYHKPARFNDALEVTCQIVSLKRASLDFAQQVRRAGEVEVLCDARVRVACLRAERFSACAIPEALRQTLQAEYSCGS